jgi:hypothetical protein
MDSTDRSQEFKGAGYELFIVTISTLAIANLLIVRLQVRVMPRSL